MRCIFPISTHLQGTLNALPTLKLTLYSNQVFHVLGDRKNGVATEIPQNLNYFSKIRDAKFDSFNDVQPKYYTDTKYLKGNVCKNFPRKSSGHTVWSVEMIQEKTNKRSLCICKLC